MYCRRDRHQQYESQTFRMEHLRRCSRHISPDAKQPIGEREGMWTFRNDSVSALQNVEVRSIEWRIASLSVTIETVSKQCIRCESHKTSLLNLQRSQLIDTVQPISPLLFFRKPIAQYQPKRYSTQHSRTCGDIPIIRPKHQPALRHLHQLLAIRLADEVVASVEFLSGAPGRGSSPALMG